jgi:hypothetical protein
MFTFLLEEAHRGHDGDRFMPRQRFRVLRLARTPTVNILILIIIIIIIITVPYHIISFHSYIHKWLGFRVHLPYTLRITRYT